MMLVVAIFLLLFLLVCGVLVFLTDSAFGGLDFNTDRATINQVIAVIIQRHLEKGIFFDLGSARGGLSSKTAKALPGLQVNGIDDSRFRVLFSYIRSIFLKNVNFRKENLFKVDVSPANIVYIYLPKELMTRLQVKLRTELKPGSLVITNRVSFPNWQPVEKLKELFIYEKE